MQEHTYDPIAAQNLRCLHLAQLHLCFAHKDIKGTPQSQKQHLAVQFIGVQSPAAGSPRGKGSWTCLRALDKER